MPSAIYPELTFSRVTIVVQGSALAARQVMFSITEHASTKSARMSLRISTSRSSG